MDHDGGALAPAPTRLVARWPKGSFAENLAVAPSGAIFVSLHTDHAVVRVDPASGRVEPFARFPEPVAGLALAADGTLYVSGGQPGNPGGVIFAVAADGTVRRLADLPEAYFLNGMTWAPDGRMLVVESVGGVIYAVAPASGAVSVWLASELLRPRVAGFTPGANGIKLFCGHAYISVTERDAILRATLDGAGRPGAPEIYATALRADDFAIGADGSLFIATHPAHSLLRLAPDGSRTTLATADEGMIGSTAVAFGRGADDRHSVYVTTTGGTMTLPDDQLTEAKLVRVDVGIGAAPEGHR